MRLNLPFTFARSCRFPLKDLFLQNMPKNHPSINLKSKVFSPQKQYRLAFTTLQRKILRKVCGWDKQYSEKRFILIYCTDKMPLKSPLVLLLLLALVQADFVEGSLTSDSIKVYRQMVYKQTQERIDKLNAAFGDYYTSVHNQFSHLTSEEFISKYTGGFLSPYGSPMRVFVDDIPRGDEAENIYSDGPNVNAQVLLNHILPNNGVFFIDYSDPSYKLVTSIKNQGSCGSCWAFAGLADIESMFLSRHKMYLDLSEQQMVDCLSAIDSKTDGCNGGSVDAVHFYASQFHVVEEKYYPYVESTGTCKQSKIDSLRGFKINGYNYIEGCTQMTSTLLASRPFTACGVVDEQWQNYGSGVVTTCNVGSIGGHCIQLVGVASDGTQEPSTNYFKYRNQWGNNWGIKGYIHLYRDYKNQTGMCGYCKGIMSY